VFARKPAPVQVNYIGYPGSTGLSAIDYRISDPWQDPPGLTERYHSESLVRIPGGMAFAPEPDAPDVNALPALSSTELVLACLNGLNKLNPAVVKLWARILHALPQARLMLGNVTDVQTAQRLTQMFGQAGVAPERLMLQPRVPVPEYLALHHTIDLALDPFPYNGGTTTMHSLWMGVPVITLAGGHAVSRLCAAHLSRVGLPEFITHSEDEYLQCAIRFANDLPALNEVRQSLRQRMSAPECQAATITRQLEAAYREMWRAWCNT
jgi:predicted O-linked N-acetylglucosamine transferase (SPINDLY family)